MGLRQRLLSWHELRNVHILKKFSIEAPVSREGFFVVVGQAQVFFVCVFVGKAEHKLRCLTFGTFSWVLESMFGPHGLC